MLIVRSTACYALVSACAAMQLGGCGGSDADNQSAANDLRVVTSPDYPSLVCEEQVVPARDGTRLKTYVYRNNKTTEKMPTLMIRSPYSRLYGEKCFAGYHFDNLVSYAQDGYVAVVQSSRGTFMSEGTFKPIDQEGQDGYDAIEWAASQPWSSGKVGMKGASYFGLTQWQAAIKRPPHLVAIAPDITASDYHDNWTYQNGVFDLWFNVSWTAGAFEADQIIRKLTAGGAPQSTIDAQVAAWTAEVAQNVDSTWTNTLPLTSLQVMNADQPFYLEWLKKPTYDASWERIDIENKYGTLDIATLTSGASYDIFSVGSARNFQGMRKSAASAAARNNARLVWRAYGHSVDSGFPTFGNDTPDPSIEKRFFDYHLKGVANGFDREPPVRIYVLVPPDSGQTGSGFWVTGDDFPLPGTVLTRYYMGSRGSANTRSGDGVLSPTPVTTGATFDSFAYDPSKPVPTVGGNVCCFASPTNAVRGGAQEQASVEQRPDVLVYTSNGMDRDTPVIGNVKASFWASSSAVDTDFTVKLVNVRPDGSTHNVVNRIVRAGYRAGSKLPPQLLTANEATRFELDLGPTAVIVPKNHKLRVQISSSDFPHYARNLNTGLDSNSTSEMNTAQQRIFHDANHQSYIELPVAPITR
ncbi:MAG: hypothetical protein PCALPYG88_6403 [uncultured Paraburkholderia sp.]|uniref:CocE/NonD family hydrolase n=1 Tax=uncultured Paraburkholderia sp. TaxID=1822466 RepID=UPI002595D1D4|nr:CocE/NonD family hydrolase [uncultured Paraburkholderia sp.]CAH2903133.1 MAG: hypothetical protein PCALPYG08_6511 [uncultured Paraburkholderia sp.]CAH2938914.1 MAG: hypothetical protein PCALPYG88_6403 [uncultured Paraburkholderia sp.]